ncbi:hypothetical protein TRFO_17302 [Tritrichomonas foetus]|uniref:Uncharacterized protein n=1 Tax=Tritrichomonas foetus TaxID=1144522 RepID=A0A1J4KTE2_9EUKA|nr:hypothetical protein TRFO_17302 [Tritrichomonas foetus]|eukprot:OHT12757.1 hypothetical protein TRFO_17302 [Tritrichomonas foetus]
MFEAEELFVIDNAAWSLASTGNPVTVIDYSPDGALVAVSNTPGEVSIVSSYDGTVKRKLSQTRTQYPVTGCKFHPSEDNLILYACRDGFIFTFNILRGEVTSMTRHLGSNLLTMSLDSFGEAFAIACADGSIRLYDIENMQRTKALIKMTGRSISSQSVTIYSLMFHPEDSNIVLSAAGNDRVLIWDVRSGTSERCISGPHIRGNGLDMYDGQIMTASCREKKAIEIWDFGTARKIRDINFDSQIAGGDCTITAAKIARNGLDMFAGGGGVNLTQAFDYSKGSFIGQSCQSQSPVVSLGASPFGASFVNGYENGEVSCYMVRVRQP